MKAKVLPTVKFDVLSFYGFNIFLSGSFPAPTPEMPRGEGSGFPSCGLKTLTPPGSVEVLEEKITGGRISSTYIVQI